jgi:ankyrin repeat protein
MELDEFKQKFPRDDWFKVLSYDPQRQKFFRRQLEFSVNTNEGDAEVTVDPIEFNPCGECLPGGIYCASINDIDRYCSGEFGDWVAKVSFPREHLGVVTRFHLEAHKLKVNQLCIYQPLPMKDFLLQYAPQNSRLFMMAMLLDHVDVVEQLVVLNPSCVDLYENYVIRWACERGSLKLVRLLLNNPRVDPSALQQEALRMACDGCYIDVVKLLLDHPLVSPKETLFTFKTSKRTMRSLGALYIVCEKGCVQLVQMLLPHIDPSHQNQAALRAAVRLGHTQVVELLLNDPRVDPSAENQDAIITACQHGWQQIVELLLSHPRVDPSVAEQTPLRLAAHRGHEGIVKRLLLDSRVDPSVQNQYALFWAQHGRHDSVVKLLLTDPRVVNRFQGEWFSLDKFLDHF